VKKRKRSQGKEEEKEKKKYWAIYYVAEEPTLRVTFVPRADLVIDLRGNVYEQVCEYMGAYSEEDDQYISDIKGYLTLDAVQNAKEIAEMFTEHDCVPVASAW